MDVIFINSENSKTNKPHRLLLALSDLKRSDENFALSNLSMYYTWENMKKSYKNNKFKISTPTWNEKYELPDRSYSVSDIQDYFSIVSKNMNHLLIFLQREYM